MEAAHGTLKYCHLNGTQEQRLDYYVIVSILQNKISEKYFVCFEEVPQSVFKAWILECM